MCDGTVDEADTRRVGKAHNLPDELISRIVGMTNGEGTSTLQEAGASPADIAMLRDFQTCTWSSIFCAIWGV